MSVIAPLLAPACLREGASGVRGPEPIWHARFDRMAVLGGAALSFSRSSPATAWGHDGLLTSVAADTPVFMHDGDGRNLGLACLSAHTNGLLHSRDLTQGVWTPSDVVVAHDATGVDGAAASACTITDAHNGSRGYIDQTVAIPDDGSSHVATVFIAKDANTARFPLIQFDLVGGSILREQIWLNTATGDVVIAAEQGSHRIEDAGNWWRVVLVQTNDGSGNVGARLRLRPANGSVIGVNADDATGSIVVDMAQIHVGTTRFAAAPIATGATPVTRAADSAVVGLAGRLPGAFGFEVMWDADGGEAQYARVLEFSDGTADNLIALIRAGDQVQCNVVSAGGFVVNANIGGWTAGRHRVVARMAPDRFAMAMDGAAPVTDGSGAVPAVDRLLLGHTTGASWLDNTLASAAVWPWAPSDDALQALSARR